MGAGDPAPYFMGASVARVISEREKQQKRESARRIRAERVAWYREIRDKTPCADCGAKMRDFHNPEHREHPERRVGLMVHTGKTKEAILAEIATCVPLCRTCHLIRDDNAALLRKLHDGGCKRGHPWTPENTSITPQGHRRCRACEREKAARRRRDKGIPTRDEFEADRASKSHCHLGHPMSGDNLRILIRGNKTERICRECVRIRNRKVKANAKR